MASWYDEAACLVCDAAARGDMAALASLVEEDGADAQARANATAAGCPCLVRAARHGRTRAVEYLLDKGARAGECSAESNALLAACEFGFGGVVSALLAHRRRVRASLLGDAVVLKLLLAVRPDAAAHLESLVASSQSLAPRGAHAAACLAAGNADGGALSALCLFDDSPLEARCSDGCNALQHAAMRGDARAAARLVSLGADTSDSLEMALLAGNLDVANVLLRHHRAAPEKALDAARLLQAAAASGDPAAVSWAAREVPSPALGEAAKAAILMRAVLSRSAAAVAAVLDHVGVDVDARFGRHTTTALIAAAVRGDAAMCAELLRRGADARYADARGLCAEHVSRHTAAAPAFGVERQTPDEADEADWENDDADDDAASFFPT
ncbi:ankyrin repeat-containing domain protein [Pelagophyceae sp. CCMP2097]|nr:ankyrin repeat-containing domain protein [Pelagophyceae sp. CCMP2097]